MGRILLSICAVVVAVGLTGSSQPQRNTGGIQGEADREAAHAPQPAPAKESDSGANLQAACEPGEDNRHSDLCAQWKAADGAAVSATWTRWTGIFTAGGLLIGFVTMVAAIGAAVFAALASKHTKRSADIAETALAADTRAWLLWKGFTIFSGVNATDAEGNPVGQMIGIVPNFTNYGRSPAVRAAAALVSGYSTFEQRNSNPSFPDLPHEPSTVVVPPGNEVNCAPIQMHGEVLRRFIERETVLFVCGHLRYHDLNAKDDDPPYESVGVFAITFNGWQGAEDEGSPNLETRCVSSRAT